jgi:lincosamide nucleotidyltransferase B/F
MPDELIQQVMIERVRSLCHEDPRIAATLMYGSFTQGLGDEFSDIEFYVFLNDSEFDAFNHIEWVKQISPTAMYYVNEIGYGIAIFENLVRGEFRFLKLSELPTIRVFGQLAAQVDDISPLLIFDPDGEAKKLLASLSGPRIEQLPKERVLWLYHSFLNAMLSGINLLARGERARAFSMLHEAVNKYLLWLVRVREGKLLQADNRAYRKLEKELPATLYRRYIECVGSLLDDNLERAFSASWVWSRELIDELALKYGFDLPRTLIESLDARLHAATQTPVQQLEGDVGKPQLPN